MPPIISSPGSMSILEALRIVTSLLSADPTGDDDSQREPTVIEMLDISSHPEEKTHCTATAHIDDAITALEVLAQHLDEEGWPLEEGKQGYAGGDDFTKGSGQAQTLNQLLSPRPTDVPDTESTATPALSLDAITAPAATTQSVTSTDTDAVSTHILTALDALTPAGISLSLGTNPTALTPSIATDPADFEDMAISAAKSLGIPLLIGTLLGASCIADRDAWKRRIVRVRKAKREADFTALQAQVERRRAIADYGSVAFGSGVGDELAQPPPVETDPLLLL